MRYGIDTDYGPQGITTVHDFSCWRYPFFRFGGIVASCVLSCAVVRDCSSTLTLEFKNVR